MHSYALLRGEDHSRLLFTRLPTCFLCKSSRALLTTATELGQVRNSVDRSYQSSKQLVSPSDHVQIAIYAIFSPIPPSADRRTSAPPAPSTHALPTYGLAHSTRPSTRFTIDSLHYAYRLIVLQFLVTKFHSKSIPSRLPLEIILCQKQSI
jgi:hypothetical protein